MRAAGYLSAALLSGSALAQDNMTTIPAPGIERYSLPPGNTQATPVPTPTPTPTPAPVPPATAPGLTPAAPPSVVPTLAIPRTSPTVAPPPAAPRARPTSAPTPAEAAPAPVATLSAVPTAIEPSPMPAPLPSATPPAGDAVAPPAVTATSGPQSWLWWVLGLALIAVAGIFARRRAAAGRAEPSADVAEPAAPTPTPPSPPSPPAKPVAAAQPAHPLVFDFRPQRLWTLGPDAHLAFELVVTNTGATPIDAVRPVIALASAGPDTAAEIAGFQANAPTLPGGEPFDLRAGETRALAGELTLPGDAMYVTSAADRELIVPVALVSLAWRNGLSLARVAEAFVIGTGDATSPRLGPIWVDRAGLVYAKLDARRFTPGPR